jgi:hypothetical protein
MMNDFNDSFDALDPGSGGGCGSSGVNCNSSQNSAPNNGKPLTPQQKQCIANATADHSTATSRAWQDANRTWGHDIVVGTGERLLLDA